MLNIIKKTSALVAVVTTAAIMTGAAYAESGTQTSGETSMQQVLTLEERKQMARDVLELAFAPDVSLEDKRARLPGIINDQKYIQHNPMADDGLDSLLGFLAFVESEYGAVDLSIKRVIGEGDLVAVHSHYKFGPKDERGSAIVDIFRFENGKIVEHWDVIQAIPEGSENPNTMF